jgi:hypothetical protein
MKDKRKAFSVGVMTIAVVSVAVLGLFSATPASASGGWGFGMSYGPSVVGSCSSYNLVGAVVDIPPKKYAGYVTGRLSNPRTGTSKGPAFGIDTVTAAGTPTLTYIIFYPPTGTVEGDILHVVLTLSAIPAGPAVGSFAYDYRCSTGEVIRRADADVLKDSVFNPSYGDDYVLADVGKDAYGRPDVELWCLDPSQTPWFKGMTVTKSDLAQMPALPAANALFDKNNSCLVPIAFYVLISGEYQITIGPDPYGVINEIIFTGLPPTNIHFFRYNVNQGPQ